MSGWAAVLNGVLIDDGCEIVELDPLCELELPSPSGWMNEPPDGMGVPGIRTEDVTFPQRDGVKMYKDWYLPRIITMQVTVCPDDDCDGGCPSARQRVQQITRAWSRQCGQSELVIYTDCHGTDEDRSVVGPFGIIGRPRQASVVWNGRTKCADMVLRFDSVDHRMYILDECGTPGSGTESVTLEPNLFGGATVCLVGGELCLVDGEICLTDPDEGPSNTMTATVEGTECSCATITLYGQLSNPVIRNLTNGEEITYNAVIQDGAPPVIIDGDNLTATQGGQSRTHLLSGSSQFCLSPGDNILSLDGFSTNDTGYAEVSWRAQVVTA